MIRVDRTLGQTLVNLLNNAAEASPTAIEAVGQWSDSALSLTIRDHGPGIPDEISAKVGTPFFTTKADKGMGLGLYLSRIILERFGGTVSLGNHPDGGSVTTVLLPLKAIATKELV
jgi:two-component system sensor histidine kinase RegB